MNKIDDFTFSQIAVLRHGLALYVREHERVRAVLEQEASGRPFPLEEARQLHAVALQLLEDPRLARSLQEVKQSATKEPVCDCTFEPGQIPYCPVHGRGHNGL